MKAAAVELRGIKYHLVYNCGAMFDIEDRYGANALDTIDGGTRESLGAVVGIFCILAAEGELLRRERGYDPQPMPDLKIDRDLIPAEWMKMRLAIMAAVNLGFEQEFESTEEVDLILLEQQKKTERKPEEQSI